ncbi:MAG: LamG domain-containing protein [Deltaproteobacteria bacterium]|nr:LamG domain-containing protein [Deltaproteobacteria bacterium]
MSQISAPIAIVCLLTTFGLSACSDDDSPALEDAALEDAALEGTGAVDTSPIVDVATDRGVDHTTPDMAPAGYPAPLSHWTFDDVDIKGASVANLVITGPIGTLVGATSGAEGVAGQGVSLDGDGDFVDFGDVLDATFAGPDKAFSVAFWFKPTALGSTQALLTKNGDSACEPVEEQRMLHSALMDNGIVSFTYQTAIAGNPKLHRSTTAVAAGTWHHVVMTYDGAQDSAPEARVSIYIAGQKEVVSPAALGIFPFDLKDGTAHLAFGARVSSQGDACIGDGAGYYTGALDELAIWDRVLSEEQVSAVHARGIGGLPL